MIPPLSQSSANLHQSHHSLFVRCTNRLHERCLFPAYLHISFELGLVLCSAPARHHTYTHTPSGCSVWRLQLVVKPFEIDYFAAKLEHPLVDVLLNRMVTALHHGCITNYTFPCGVFFLDNPIQRIFIQRLIIVIAVCLSCILGQSGNFRETILAASE